MNILELAFDRVIDKDIFCKLLFEIGYRKKAIFERWFYCFQVAYKLDTLSDSLGNASPESPLKRGIVITLFYFTHMEIKINDEIELVF